MKRRLLQMVMFILLMVSVAMPVFANSPPGDIPEAGFIGAILYVLFVVISLVVTLATESLLSFVFPGCMKYTGMILLTNLCSQILMHTLYAATERFFAKQLLLVVILEVMVYCGEYFFYRWRMKNVPKLEILIFTLSANTLSLLTGLWAIRVITG